MKKYLEPLKESLKEPLRLLIIGILPIAIAYFTELNYWWAGGLIVILRWLDKLLHEIGKAESTKKEESVLLKGLTRF